jgi:hypothetical protein
MTDVNANGVQTQEVTIYDADGVPVLPATATLQTNGAAKTQIVDGDGDVAEVISGVNTGVKGIRVYIGPTDPISDIPVVMQFDHHQVHEGEAWKWHFIGAVNATTKDVRFSIPVLTATTRTPHLLMELIADNTSATIYLYEGTTFTAVGTDDSARIFNRNRNVAGAPSSKVYVSGATALTPNALGTLLEVGYVFTGKGAMSAERSTMEWALKANTEYLVRVVTVGSGTVLLRLNFYEDKGV